MLLNGFMTTKLTFIGFLILQITDQDYPNQPLLDIEKFLAETKQDGFLHYFEALSEKSEWGIKERRERYLYHQYWRLGVFLSLWQRAVLKPLKSIINNTQPFVRISWSYDGLMIDFCTNSTPSNEKFLCYGGYYFHTLPKKCFQFLSKFYKPNPDLVL